MKSKNKSEKQHRKNKSQITEKTIIECGFLYWVLRKIKSALKAFWYLFVFRGRKKLENPMKEIYELWEEDWLSDKNYERPFLLLFKYDYEYCSQKAKENKKKNFRLKFCCILPFLIVTILYLGGVIAYNANIYIQSKGNWTEFIQNNNWNFSICGTVFYAVAILLTYVTSKWLDVKQYQETWSRHAEHKYAVEIEMFKYISYIDEYYFPDRREKFIENIMKTWDKNQQKFVDNMKNEKCMKPEELISNMKE